MAKNEIKKYTLIPDKLQLGYNKLKARAAVFADKKNQSMDKLDAQGVFSWLNIIESHPQYAYQGPRFIKIGSNSGEEFREKVLIPWLNKLRTPEYEGYRGIIDFDGTEIYTPSFLHEAFGGAVYQGYVELLDIEFVGIPKEELKRIYKYMRMQLSKQKLLERCDVVRSQAIKMHRSQEVIELDILMGFIKQGTTGDMQKFQDRLNILAKSIQTM